MRVQAIQWGEKQIIDQNMQYVFIAMSVIPEIMQLKIIKFCYINLNGKWNPGYVPNPVNGGLAFQMAHLLLFSF